MYGFFGWEPTESPGLTLRKDKDTRSYMELGGVDHPIPGAVEVTGTSFWSESTSTYRCTELF